SPYRPNAATTTFGLNAAPYEADERANNNATANHDARRTRPLSNLVLPGDFFRNLSRIAVLPWLGFGGWTSFVVSRQEPAGVIPQSKPAAHVAPCTSFNVGDEGMCCAVLSRFRSGSLKPAAIFERLACRLGGSLRSARPMLSVA